MAAQIKGPRDIRQEVNWVEHFLSELGRDIGDDERVMVAFSAEATTQTGADGKKLNAGFWPKPWKLGKHIAVGENCFVCISSSIRTPNPKTGELRFWRSEANFGSGLALMVDDIGTGKGSKGGLSIDYFIDVLPPTAIVETSPGNHQLWYFFDAPEKSLPYFKTFLAMFVGTVLDKGGDRTIKDVTRFGRLPGGVNNKRVSATPGAAYKYADAATGKPWRVKLRHFDKAARYSIDTIAAKFGFQVFVPPPREMPTIDAMDFKINAWWMKAAIDILSAAKQGEGSGGLVQQNMSGKYRIACPWGHEHTNGDPFGAYFRGPIPGAEVEFVFGCGHDTCRRENRRKWDEFVDAVVMTKVEAELDEINNKAFDVAGASKQ